MIKLGKVTYRYRSRQRAAIDNLSLTINQGEFVAVMGANGSGKSTFARLIAGLIRPQEGTITIDTQHHHGPPVGILFQNPDNQLVAVTVDKEVAFSLENTGVPPDNMPPIMERALHEFGIGHLANRLTNELSGGEKQRLALAAIMVLNPPVLVLDEPDSFLDEPGRKQLHDYLFRLRVRSPQTTIVHITQYERVARDYGRLIVFHEGQVAADGGSDSVLSNDALCEKAAIRVRASEATVESVGDRAAHVGRSIRSLKFSNATFGFEEKSSVLKNTSFTLTSGEVVAIVGESGCGKSTAGYLLCGLLKPEDGEVVCENISGATFPVGQRPGVVAGVFQVPERQFFLHSCEQELQYGPNNFDRELTPEKLTSYLELVGLNAEQFRKRDPQSLSGGEKRRLAFAAALSFAPRFVVFDEPTCGLDAEGVARFESIVKSLKYRGVGTAIITHDGGVVKRLADRVIHLEREGAWRAYDGDDFFSTGAYSGIVSEPE
jgi:energy-coupling factor transporter ATP-binding protein EcfA2